MKIKFKKKQHGVSIIAALFTISTLTTVMVFAARYLENQTIMATAIESKNRLQQIIDASQRFFTAQLALNNQADNINNFPASYADLEAGYLPSCSVANYVNGNCKRLSMMPFGNGNGEAVTFRRGTDAEGYPEIDLSFDLSSAETPRHAQIYRSEISKLSNYSETAAGIVNIKITRPANAAHFDSLVARDGSRSLTDHWDLGNYALLNARDVMMRNNAASWSSVAAGIVRDRGRVKNDEWVTKVACPSGMRNDIELYFVSNSPEVVHQNFRDTGPISVFIRSEDASRYQLGIQFTAKLTSTQQNHTMHHGAIGYMQFCSYT